MTPAYDHLVSTSHVLRAFGREPASLLAKLPTASGGESVMIRAALSLIPAAWLEAAGLESPPFRLSDVSSLDGGNTRALVEAIALEADHSEVL